MINKKKYSLKPKIFFDLLWKTETFKDVEIDENYNINLIHSKGFNCLGSVSAAEENY